MSQPWVYEEWRNEEYSGFVALEIAHTEKTALAHLREQHPNCKIEQETDPFWGNMYVARPEDNPEFVSGRIRTIGEV